MLISREKVSDVFELLMQINTWLEQIKNDDLYIDGIRRILQVNKKKIIQIYLFFIFIDS